MHNEEDYRELAKVARMEADAATGPVKTRRLRNLARTYERQAEELAGGRVEADS